MKNVGQTKKCPFCDEELILDTDWCFKNNKLAYLAAMALGEVIDEEIDEDTKESVRGYKTSW